MLKGYEELVSVVINVTTIVDEQFRLYIDLGS